MMILKEKILHNLLKLFYKARFKFGYTYENFDPNRLDPYVLLGNHSSLNDGLYTALPLERYPYPVINVFMFTSPLMRFVLNHLIKSIPKRKGQSDISTIKAMLDIIKTEKRGVMIFPEGNSSFFGKESPIPYSTAKFLKKVKLDVVIAHVNGGYLCSPRWAKKPSRKGLFEVNFKTLYKAEELDNVSVEELDIKIVEALRFNDFDWNRNQKHIYPSKTKALGLERFIYACPHCGEIHCISTKGNKIYCKYCGEIAHFNDYSLIEGVPFDNLIDWDIYQKSRLPYFINRTFLSKGKLYSVDMTSLKSTFFGKQSIELKDRSINFVSNKQTLNISIDEIVNLVLVKHNDLAFDYQDKTYYVRIDNPMLFLDIINYKIKELK
ncbi:MAG: hypothetical protein CVV56_03735 [Tenericutes bacterium HGW-Tenericutes-1]|jgi:1-acyl-sn-glycerol-3-phosphate acyltransferase/transcription elongation factor Elf1|nr:MAG: hypothetical protein CVV56_03735 [Tenericutes bacterium HGW-Tenericutes-1]